MLLWALLLALALASPATARDMKLTIYDDGISCPGHCDAHVVMNNQDNGTRYAFQPGSSRAAPQACLTGEKCNICFGEADDTCMAVTYRGGGPPIGTFDFTPAFYDANCPRVDVPAALRNQCRSLDKAVTKFGYDKRINCFNEPANSKCVDAVQAALAAQAADRPKRERCLAIGEKAYNKEQTVASEKRTIGCNYTLLLLGGRPEKRWHLLLPGACRSGTFVDQFGLDCCNSSARFAAGLHPECTPFFPQ